jgi:serine/threonine protein kinase/WD40 repeat protein
MTADDPTQVDEQFAAWLAASAEALAEGSSPTLPDPAMVPAELRPRMERALAGLQLLQQLRPSSNSTMLSSQRARELQTDPPWKTLGRFQLVRELGRGGFGIVYLARDPLLKREVALKVPRPEAVITPELRARFYQEAQAASTLQHPNLVTVYEAGEVGPVCFIVYGYCPGITLAQWIKEQTEPVPFDTSAKLVATLADAVAHAHEHGVVHRDLKPSNVLLQIADCRAPIGEEKATLPSQTAILNRQSAIPRITDFGLAKNFLQDQGEPNTRSGAIVGTVNYMAPEQARGKTREVGPVTDIYALGAVLYELLTGRTPFQGESDLDTLLQVQFEEPLPPARLRPKVPRDLETVCLKCLQKEAHKRYANAADLAADLQRYLRREPVRARRSSRPEHVWRWCRRNPLLAGLTSTVALLLLTLTVGSTVAAFLLQKQRDATRAQLHHTEEAKEDARRATQLAEQRFYQLARAGANRSSGRVGRRFKSLTSLAEAARLLPSLAVGPEAALELRNDAIACLALADSDLERGWNGFPLGRKAVACDADFKRYAVDDGRESVIVFQIEDDRELFRLSGVGDLREIPFLRFSPDGRLLAVRHEAGPDRQIAIWDLERRQRILNANRAEEMAFSPDSRGAAIGHKDGSVRLYNLATGKPGAQFSVEQPGTYFSCLSFNGPGNRLAVAAQQRPDVQIWNLDQRQLSKKLPHAGEVWSVSWHPDNHLLACAGQTRIVLWDVETGSQRAVMQAHQDNVRHIAFNANGEMLASVGQDTTLRFWDVESARPLLSVPSDAEFQFHRDGERIWHRNGSRLEILRLATGGECRSLDGLDSVVDISPDGRLLAAATLRGLRLWDLQTNREIAGLPLGFAYALAFDASGKYLITCSRLGVHRWPITAVSRPRAETVHLGPPEAMPPPADARPQTISLSRDGRAMVVGIGDYGGAIVDVTAQKIRAQLTGQKHLAFPVISPDGKWIATGAWNGKEIKIWDARTGAEVQSIPLAGVESARVAFSPDSAWLVAAARYEYGFWRLGSRTWEFSHRFPYQGPGDVPGLMSFTADGKMLAVAHAMEEIKLLEAATGRELATLHSPSPGIPKSLCFSRDGSLLAVGLKPMIQLWDLRQIRKQLAAMELDWPSPARPPEPSGQRAPLTVQLDLGERGWYFLAVQALEDSNAGRWPEALAGYERALTCQADIPMANNNLAWLLATCPNERLRDIPRSMALAKKALALATPQKVPAKERGIYCNTLGTALYRAGDWQGALRELRQSVDLQGANAWDQFFLAMAHAKLGDKQKAQEYFDQAVQWMDKHKPQEEELRRFHAEAAHVLGLHEGSGDGKR